MANFLIGLYRKNICRNTHLVSERYSRDCGKRLRGVLRNGLYGFKNFLKLTLLSLGNTTQETSHLMTRSELLEIDASLAYLEPIDRKSVV